MAVFVRFILLAFFFELGIIFSIQATDGVVALAPQKDAQVIQNQTAFITSADLFLGFEPFEIQEKNEQNEINKKEDTDISGHCIFCFFDEGLIFLKSAKNTLRHFSFSFLHYKLALFIVFHTWKFHL